jgi:TolB protein
MYASTNAKAVIAAIALACGAGNLGMAFGDQVDLEAYASGFDSIPIAIIQFEQQPGTSPLAQNRPWEIIASDLNFSGRFLAHELPAPDSVYFEKHAIGIYVHGSYSVQGNSVTLECNLHDATSMRLLAGKKYRGELSKIRAMSHRYSNELFALLLGEEGPFESRMLYVVDKGASKNLAIMDYDGHNHKQLTQAATVNIFPAFIDSASIVWTAFFRGKPDLYKGSINSGKFGIFVYSRSVETSPCYSPITGLVAYASSRSGNLEIYTCDVSGAGRKQLTFSQGIDTSPTWSPNGHQIAFTSDRSGQPQIYVMDADGVNSRRLTFNSRYQDSPAWSPRGDLIAYSSLNNGKFDIWVIGADGSDARAVTSMPGNNEYPTWSPDGSHIAFVSTRGGSSDIYAVRANGEGVKRITRQGTAKMPDWSHF